MEYKKITDLYRQLEGTTKRIAKFEYISKFLKTLPQDEIEDVILLLQGKISYNKSESELGVSTKLIIKGVAKAAGLRDIDVENAWKKQGDLGIACETILSKTQQTTLFRETLEVSQLMSDLRKIRDSQGSGSTDIKIKIISKLLSMTEPEDARYIIRTILEDMRTGAGEGVIRDAILRSCPEVEGLRFVKNNNIEWDMKPGHDIKVLKEKLDTAISLTNNLGKVARIAMTKGQEGLEKIDIILFNPVKLMLFPKSATMKEAFSVVGSPCAIEYKYDGFRIQIHKKDRQIRLFTRRLDDVTEQFPDVVDVVRNMISAQNCVLDGEVVGFDPDTKKYLPFQSISQRIRRKYNIDEIAKKFPVELNLFDILYIEDKNTLRESFAERREILEKISLVHDKKLVLAEQIVTDSEEDALEFYKKSLSLGFEGVMLKSLDAPYSAGRRVGPGVKLKPVLEELDLVITKAEWGTGKRGKWLTSYTVACEGDDGELLEVGKVSSGLKELEEEGYTFEQMTNTIIPLITQEKGKEVVVAPEIVIEVHYEEIQKSPTYSSGFALRFPRIMRVRDDKGVDEIATIYDIDRIYAGQKGKE